eukprot:CAMPEP_0196654356 /NCGR_PEP_ID=MMETSP1086-20130531/4062_1 /TAXON_ID=77921 /ORGANISM="Cyanoptyche  gloeocystis , Strain SAG4.97" /LENGTH=180 /DNA_ID=CAMNT_0041986069 /DNA_START=94 /DNA_END=633 /DNA_ORIENTATION=-
MPLTEVLAVRHSGRSYDPSKLVSAEQLRLVCEAARSAPSCYNDQPWIFIIGDKATDASAWEKIFNSLVPFNQNWAKDAPVLLAVVANTKFSHTGSIGKDNGWGPYDTGCAAGFLMLKATSLGLMAHQMGGFKAEVLQAEFAIPEHFKPMAIMSLGYEAHDAQVPARTRVPLGDNFYMGSW